MVSYSMRVGKYVQVKSKSPKCVVLRVEYCVEENRILENTAFEKSTRMTYSQVRLICGAAEVSVVPHMTRAGGYCIK